MAGGEEQIAGGGEEMAGGEEEIAGGEEEMAGGGSSKSRKKVEATPADAGAGPSIVRAKDGSAFARCDECGKSVPAALINMHGCSKDAKVRKNLESQTVERQIEAKKPARKRSAPKVKKSRTEEIREKKDKDPNTSKRPLSSFFLFMEDFRKSYKEANPDCKGVEVSKEGGEKWKSLTDEEKKPYQDKAAELKAEYELLNAENEDDEEEVEEKEVEEITDEE